MEYGEIQPHPALVDYVHCFWWMKGAVAGAGGGEWEGERQAVLPDGRPELVLNFGDPFLHHTADAGGVAQPPAVFVGQITGPLVLQPSGGIDLVGVRFHASGLHALTGLPVTEMLDDWVALGEAWGLGGALRDRVGEADTLAGRIAFLQETLVVALRRRTGACPSVLAAEGRIRGSRGSLTMDRVAKEVGLSPRQLRRRFRAETGIGPKLLARMVRLQALIRRASERPNVGLARLAVQAGYYDQAHLSRDFRDLAGTTASRYLAGSRSLAHHFLDDERWEGRFPTGGAG